MLPTLKRFCPEASKASSVRGSQHLLQLCCFRTLLLQFRFNGLTMMRQFLIPGFDVRIDLPGQVRQPFLDGSGQDGLGIGRRGGSEGDGGLFAVLVALQAKASSQSFRRRQAGPWCIYTPLSLLNLRASQDPIDKSGAAKHRELGFEERPQRIALRQN